MVRFALIALLTATPAVAQQAAPQQQQPQPITKAQFIANVDQRFNAIDANNDGFNDAAEFEAARAKIFEARKAAIIQDRQKAFNELDANKDGQLSLAEFNSVAAAQKLPASDSAAAIAKVDTNKDGKVSREESHAPALAQFAMVDADGDGTASVAEQRAAAQKVRQAAAAAPAGR